jgi:excisionase family DNA binding protein
MARTEPRAFTVEEASRMMGVSLSTIWRMIRRGALSSYRKGGRRWIPEHALGAARPSGARAKVPAFTREHPIFRLIGAGHGGGAAPGARDKHAILTGNG